MTPLERETKLTLSAEDYHRVREVGRILECRDQLNIYLHDPDRLHESVGYFRVRFESGRSPVATLKIQVGWRGAMREMIEVERPLEEMGPALYPWPRRWVVVDSGVPEGFMEHLQALGITRLRRLGWMRNLRCVLDLGSVAPVELDRTVLPGGTVLHEVEIESTHEEAHALLVDRIRELAPSATISPVGKFARFLEAVAMGGRGRPLR
jgi:hypothetical protein